MSANPCSEWCARWGLRDVNGEPIQADGGSPVGVGAGWFSVLDRLVEDLIAMGWDRRVRLVKEKYGTLSIFIESDLRMWKRIDQAELESETVCETCGAPGRLPEERRWMLTLCDRCDAVTPRQD